MGGGSVYIYIKQKYPYRKYWVNELYRELYLFWKESRDNINDVISQIRQLKNEYNEGKKLYDFLKYNIHKFNYITQAAAFFIFNRITFSGTSLSGGFSNMAYDGRFTESSIQRLKNFSTIIGNTNITNTDYEESLTAKGNNVFIFLDPPYYSATKSALYGRNGNLHK